jgi:dihydroorotate dehydrogenase (NAD+) catalytic subunit
MNLSVQIGKLRMQNPVTVASGTFGYGVEYARLLDLNQLGAVTVKGIRLNPVRGNPTPRTAEVTSGMLNAIGLQGPGVEVLAVFERAPGADDHQHLGHDRGGVRRGRAAV